jgi:hypothetical protein
MQDEFSIAADDTVDARQHKHEVGEHNRHIPPVLVLEHEVRHREEADQAPRRYVRAAQPVLGSVQETDGPRADPHAKKERNHGRTPDRVVPEFLPDARIMGHSLRLERGSGDRAAASDELDVWTSKWQQCRLQLSRHG